jgi:hypothetical protein
MKLQQMKRGRRVVDRWWPEWGTGVVKKVLKTRVRIDFAGTLRTYDLAHLQFLEAE